MKRHVATRNKKGKTAPRKEKVFFNDGKIEFLLWKRISLRDESSRRVHHRFRADRTKFERPKTKFVKFREFSTSEKFAERFSRRSSVEPIFFAESFRNLSFQQKLSAPFLNKKKNFSVFFIFGSKFEKKIFSVQIDFSVRFNVRFKSSVRFLVCFYQSSTEIDFLNPS